MSGAFLLYFLILPCFYLYLKCWRPAQIAELFIVTSRLPYCDWLCCSGVSALVMCSYRVSHRCGLSPSPSPCFCICACILAIISCIRLSWETHKPCHTPNVCVISIQLGFGLRDHTSASFSCKIISLSISSGSGAFLHDKAGIKRCTHSWTEHWYVIINNHLWHTQASQWLSPVVETKLSKKN